MNEKIKKIIKTPKLLVALGVCGILLVFISSLFEGDNKTKEKNTTDNTTYTAEQYCENLENDIKNIVYSITGDKKATVVITLESGIKYSYASANETDISSSTGSVNDQSSESKKQSYITIKSADGGEEALIVTEIMPEVRGVAIVCIDGNNEYTVEKIKNAVTAACAASSARHHA